MPSEQQPFLIRLELFHSFLSGLFCLTFFLRKCWKEDVTNEESTHSAPNSNNKSGKYCQEKKNKLFFGKWSNMKKLPMQRLVIDEW